MTNLESTYSEQTADAAADDYPRPFTAADWRNDAAMRRQMAPVYRRNGLHRLAAQAERQAAEAERRARQLEQQREAA